MRILKSLAIIGVVAAMAASATGAQFTDQYTNTDNTFATGTVKIGTAPATAFISADNMKPGGPAVTKDLVVQNNGSLDFTYRIWAYKQDGDGDLYNALVVTIVDSTGSTVYNGPLSNLTQANPAPGTPKSLTAKGSDTLTFTVLLPPEVDGPQGVSTKVAFVFDAVQQ
jgi:hypothetical protein